MARSSDQRAGFVSGALLALLLLAAAQVSRAGPAPSEAAVKAAYLFRFAGYIEWPGGEPQDYPFVIGVVGDPDVARELRRLVPGHLIDHHTVEVRDVVRMQEVDHVQILYVGPDHDEFLRALRPRNSEPTLVVTDEEQGLDLGGMLNFMTVDKHVRFEVSLTAADHAHLRISAELLSVALRVHGGGRQSEESWFPFWRPPDSSSRLDQRAAQLGPLRRRRTRADPPPEVA